MTEIERDVINGPDLIWCIPFPVTFCYWVVFCFFFKKSVGFVFLTRTKKTSFVKLMRRRQCVSSKGA